MALLTRPDLPATSTRATLNNHTVVMVVRRAPALECDVEVKHGRSLAQGKSGVNGWGYMLRPGQKNHTRMPWSKVDLREQEFGYGSTNGNTSFFIFHTIEQTNPNRAKSLSIHVAREPLRFSATKFVRQLV